MTSPPPELEPEPLAWDSQFLGFPVARLRAGPGLAAGLPDALARARAAGFRLIYLFVDPADAGLAAAAHRVGARLVDSKLTFGRPVAGPLRPPLPGSAGGTPLAPATELTDGLLALAWQSGAYSRFRRDPGFGSGVYRRLYRQWLEASLSGELARTVLAAGPAAGPEVGLLTLAQAGAVARIGLLAVEAAARGQGLGQRLLEAARQRAQAWGCTHLEVATQRDNAPACRLYHRAGFVVLGEEHVYHLWL